VAYGAAAVAATYTWPDACLLRWPPYAVFATAGGILLALGVPMWLTAIISVMRAYKRDELVTSGVFGLVRHPVYSAIIVLALPGIALLTRSWPLFLMPLVAYTVFKLLIHREDEYLDRRFGRAYLDYRARVNEVIPIPRFWSSGK
jgi:protein-S-isoprenylcysteine O-methyltransferase Ste14